MNASTIRKHSKATVPKLLEKATKIFNEYIRLRDQGTKQFAGMFYCISCAKWKPIELMHAGHYMAAGHHAAVRFDEGNVNGQCVGCNTFKHGNQALYRHNLIIKIGLEEVELIERKAKQVAKWDRYALIDIIETYTEKVKSFKKCN